MTGVHAIVTTSAGAVSGRQSRPGAHMKMQVRAAKVEKAAETVTGKVIELYR
jgi:hypothetical protein